MTRYLASFRLLRGCAAWLFYNIPLGHLAPHVFRFSIVWPECRRGR